MKAAKEVQPAVEEIPGPQEKTPPHTHNTGMSRARPGRAKAYRAVPRSDVPCRAGDVPGHGRAMPWPGRAGPCHGRAMPWPCRAVPGHGFLPRPWAKVRLWPAKSVLIDVPCQVRAVLCRAKCMPCRVRAVPGRAKSMSCHGFPCRAVPRRSVPAGPGHAGTSLYVRAGKSRRR